MEINHATFCRGCKWGCWKEGKWLMCDIYIGTRFVLKPEPDGKGGCIYHTGGKQQKKAVRPERKRQDERWGKPWTSGYSRYK